MLLKNWTHKTLKEIDRLIKREAKLERANDPQRNKVQEKTDSRYIGAVTRKRQLMAIEQELLQLNDVIEIQTNEPN